VTAHLSLLASRNSADTFPPAAAATVLSLFSLLAPLRRSGTRIPPRFLLVLLEHDPPSAIVEALLDHLPLTDQAEVFPSLVQTFTSTPRLLPDLTKTLCLLASRYHPSTVITSSLLALPPASPISPLLISEITLSSLTSPAFAAHLALLALSPALSSSLLSLSLPSAPSCVLLLLHSHSLRLLNSLLRSLSAEDLTLPFYLHLARALQLYETGAFREQRVRALGDREAVMAMSRIRPILPGAHEPSGGGEEEGFDDDI
jgi:hypothetical protein